MGNREVLQSAAGNLPLTVIQGPISSIRSEDNRDYAEGRVREVPTARCHNGIIRRGSRIKISMVHTHTPSRACNARLPTPHLRAPPSYYIRYFKG